jgi:hypothetical protein
MAEDECADLRGFPTAEAVRSAHVPGECLATGVQACRMSTRRQHAIAVYQMAGLAGRAELAAYVLEDLLPSGSDGGLTPYHGADARVETGATEVRK